MFELGDFTSASEVYRRLLSDHPDQVRGWLFRLRLLIVSETAADVIIRPTSHQFPLASSRVQY